MIGGRYTASCRAKSGLSQRMDQPVRGERLAARRADRDPVSQCQRLRPQPVHTGTVAGGQYREDAAPSGPHRTTLPGALVVPKPAPPERWSACQRAECRSDTVGDVAGSPNG